MLNFEIHSFEKKIKRWSSYLVHRVLIENFRVSDGLASWRMQANFT